MELVPFDDRDGWIWWDGALVPWRDAKLHVLTHGLHYASAAFEGERAYAGNIFRLREHTERLVNSARILGFEIPYSPEQIDAASNQVLAANRLTDGVCAPDRLAWQRNAGGGGTAHQNSPGDRRLALAHLLRCRSDGRHSHGHGGVEATVTRDGANRGEGDRPLHDRHAGEASCRAAGLCRCPDARLAWQRRRDHQCERVLRDGRRTAHPEPGLLPGRHYPPIGDEPGTAAADQGGGTAHCRIRDWLVRPRCSWPAPPRK